MNLGKICVMFIFVPIHNMDNSPQIYFTQTFAPRGVDSDTGNNYFYFM